MGPGPDGPGGAPAQPGGGPAPGRVRPPEIVTAAQLWLASIVVGVVGAVLGVLTLDGSFTDELATGIGPDSGLGPAEIDAVLRVAAVLAVVVGVALVALEVFLVLKMRAGRRWARTILLVLGTFSVFSALSGLSTAELPVAGIGLLQAALLVSAVVYLATAEARAYFARPPRPR